MICITLDDEYKWLKMKPDLIAYILFLFLVFAWGHVY